jgi:hypothetical protein
MDGADACWMKVVMIMMENDGRLFRVVPQFHGHTIQKPLNNFSL